MLYTKPLSYALITRRENDYVSTRWGIRGGLELLQETEFQVIYSLKNNIFYHNYQNNSPGKFKFPGI